MLSANFMTIETAIPLSAWLMIMTITTGVYLAAARRQAREPLG